MKNAFGGLIGLDTAKERISTGYINRLLKEIIIMWHDVLVSAMMTIILHYINVSNQHIVHLTHNTMLSISYISIKKNRILETKNQREQWLRNTEYPRLCDSYKRCNNACIMWIIEGEERNRRNAWNNNDWEFPKLMSDTKFRSRKLTNTKQD